MEIPAPLEAAEAPDIEAERGDDSQEDKDCTFRAPISEGQGGDVDMRLQAGKALRDFLTWIGRADAASSPEEGTEVDEEFSASVKSPDLANWRRGFRRVAGLHAAQVDEQGQPKWIGSEIYAEDMQAGIRLSVYYDFSGIMIGRAYFDKGDIPAKQVAKHLAQWESLVSRGRPRTESPLRLSDSDVYEKLDTRKEWYAESVEADPKYQPTLKDAADWLVGIYLPVSRSEEEFVQVVAQVLKAFEREKKRRGKK